MSAILAHTKRVIFLEDGDVADVRPSGVVVTDVAGTVQERRETEITWSAAAAEKGGYEHFMLKEIHEQPESITRCLRGRVMAEEGNAWLGGFDLSPRDLRNVSRVVLLGCGTSYHAGCIGA